MHAVPAPADASKPNRSLTSELASETRKHLAFSCYCAACENTPLPKVLASALKAAPPPDDAR